jgi:hypothetical protein
VRLRWLPLLLALGLAACNQVRSQKPLSDPATARVDEWLVGTWTGVLDDRPFSVHVMGHKDGQLDVVIVSDRGGTGAQVLLYQGHETVHEGVHYLSVREKTFKEPLGEEYTLAPRWIFARLDRTKDGGLKLSWLNGDLVIDAIESGAIKGKAPTGGEPIIEDDPAKILTFIAKSDPTRLWKPLKTTLRKFEPPGSGKAKPKGRQ